MWTLARFVTLAVVITTAGCTPTYRNHGYIPPEEELQKLAVGVDTRATVESSVGPPTAGGVLSGGDLLLCSQPHKNSWHARNQRD